MKASKVKVNKSAAVRDILGRSPTLGITAIVRQLAGDGVSVSPNLIYNIRAELNKKRPARSTNAPPAASSVNGAASSVNGAASKMSTTGTETGRFSTALPAMSDGKERTRNVDVVAAIRAIMQAAATVGGLFALKLLVDAMNEQPAPLA